MADISKSGVIVGDAHEYNNGSAQDEAQISPWSSTNVSDKDIQKFMEILMKDDTIQELRRMVAISNIAVPIATVLILVFGLIGNGLVIYITLVTDRTRNHPIHSMFVLNLAVADILFLLVSGPYWITINATSAWRFGSFLCSFIPFLLITSTASSIYTICALAWIRFMALTMPFRFQRSCISTRKAGYIVLIAIWIAGTALSLPNLIYMKLVQENIQGHQIIECRWHGSRASRAFSWVLTIFTYVLPLIIVISLYIIIGREVLCFMRNYGDRRPNPRKAVKTEEEKERFKSTMVVLSLILAFLICWLPHFLSNVLRFAGAMVGPGHIKGRFILQVVGQCMAYAHACVNPFVYTFASPTFRRGLRRSLRRKCKGQHNGETGCIFRKTRRNDYRGQSSLQSSNGSSCPRRMDQTYRPMNTIVSTNGANATSQVSSSIVFDETSMNMDGICLANEDAGNRISLLPTHHKEGVNDAHLALLHGTAQTLELAPSSSEDQDFSEEPTSCMSHQKEDVVS